MKNSELDQKHRLYHRLIGKWKYYMAAYEGVDALLEAGALRRHEGETTADYERRMNSAYGFNYSRSIVDIFNYYLFEKDPEHELQALLDLDLWPVFEDDCDLYGTSLNQFLEEQEKYASIFGHVGILVDKPRVGLDPESVRVVKDEKELGVYPFLTAYHPAAILDWEYRRDLSGRPVLAMVKLLDEDETYLIWQRDGWERWKKSKDNERGETRDEAILVESGPNPLGEVPFVWLVNAKGRHRNIGVSDIADIYRMDVSNLDDLSSMTEALTYSGFPMLMHPYLKEEPVQAEDEEARQSQSIKVGPKCILWFDPEDGDAKPDWLIPRIGEIVEATLQVIQKKSEEAYRMSNVGGLGGIEVSKQVKSGVALKQEFKILNSVLSKKAAGLEEAEKAIVRLWLAWSGQGKVFDRLSFKRPRDFSVEDLSADLENALAVKAVTLGSPTAQKEIALASIKRCLNLTDETLEKISVELEKSLDKTGASEWT